MEWKQSIQIPTTCMIGPAQSPDFNIIETHWRMMKILLQRRELDIQSRQDILDTVADIRSAFKQTNKKTRKTAFSVHIYIELNMVRYR